MRLFVFLGLAIFVCAAAEPEAVSLRGKLVQTADKPPVIEKDGKRIALDGDEPTLKVLNDERLNGADFEVRGQFTAPGRFSVGHIHTQSLFVYRGDKKLVVSYWCDVCYIRTSSPGKCWCCQKYTDLDPVEPQN